jgi:glycosyltransferase involved in cell wall biosynthesis
MNSTFPFVSAIIVTRNEQENIAKCIQSLFEQDYPKEKYEIVIIDGKSTDKTLELIQIVETKYRDLHNSGVPKVSILINEKLSLAAGWNIGIKSSSGEYVVRIDGHAYASTDFIRKSVETMLSVGDAVCVGGTIETIGVNEKGELIKEALTSPFGVGGSKFRYSKVPGYVDTVAYGLYQKKIFYTIDFFDEFLERTQDNDLHRKIRAKGGKFYLNPEIKTFYYSRSTFKKLTRQQFQNGKWTMINFMRRPGKMAVRHFIPLFFDLGIFFLIILGLLNSIFLILAIFVIIFHLGCGFYFAMKNTKKLSHLIKLPFVFLLIHCVYGIGSICGFLSKNK